MIAYESFNAESIFLQLHLRRIKWAASEICLRDIFGQWPFDESVVEIETWLVPKDLQVIFTDIYPKKMSPVPRSSLVKEKMSYFITSETFHTSYFIGSRVLSIMAKINGSWFGQDYITYFEFRLLRVFVDRKPPDFLLSNSELKLCKNVKKIVDICLIIRVFEFLLEGKLVED